MFKQAYSVAHMHASYVVDTHSMVFALMSVDVSKEFVPGAVVMEFEDATRADAIVYVVNIQLHGVEDILQSGCAVGSVVAGDCRVFCMQQERRAIRCNMLLDSD